MKRNTLLLLPLLGIMLFNNACDKGDPSPGTDGKELVLTAEEQAKVKTDNRFALDMFLSVIDGLSANENVFISPFSISAALAMTNNGAKGETRNNISNTLHFGELDERTINGYYKKLIQDLPLLDVKTTLNIANSIWYRNNFSVLPDFLQTNQAYFNAETAALDFASPSAPGRINDWVNEKTKTKIPTIIDNIPADAVMYLINAIYFKGQWDKKFDKSNTQKQAFHKPDGTTVQADFMQLEHTFNVAANNDYEAIELPYTNGKYSMVVVQPKENRLIPYEFISSLQDEDAWEQLMGSFSVGKVKLKFPKFTFSYENKLNDELMGLGMVLPFSNGADFSGINGTGNIKISEVKHKAFVEVNEEGTEAAAVTSVGVGLTSVGPGTIYELTINKPFLFFIRERMSGLILFAGQVNNPLITETKAD